MLCVFSLLKNETGEAVRDVVQTWFFIFAVRSCRAKIKSADAYATRFAALIKADMKINGSLKVIWNDLYSNYSVVNSHISDNCEVLEMLLTFYVKSAMVGMEQDIQGKLFVYIKYSVVEVTGYLGLYFSCTMSKFFLYHLFFFCVCRYVTYDSK